MRKKKKSAKEDLYQEDLTTWFINPTDSERFRAERIRKNAEKLDVFFHENDFN